MLDYTNLNKYQTPLTDKLVKVLPKELYSSLIEFIESVSLINWLIQPEKIRGTIKDRPWMTEDDRSIFEGRRKIDITKPHILEDMDYFRERAIFYEKNGRYTNLMPNGNPKSEYALFWKEELRRWKEGYAREDGEWIPGYLYFYWNYSPIWLVELDSVELTYEKWLAKIITLDVKKKKKGKGTRKKEFAKPWLGDYLYYHYIDQARESGAHGKLLKTRGVGFSFKMASISPCNMHTIPGSGNPNFHLASEKGFLEGDKGIWGKILDTLDWLAENTPMPRMRLTDKATMNVQYGYKDPYGVRKGLLSSVHGISLKDNPDKARGIRGPLIHYEEDGLFPNLEKAWGVNRKAVEDGDVGSGFMLAGGTGGTVGASFEGSEKLFYSPGAYNIYSVPNVYDKNTNGGTDCGFFWGAYMNRNSCYDKNTGEPDVIKALLEILSNRRQIKYSSTDPNAITQAMAEEPIVPQEAVMRTEGTIFPVADLKDVLSDIMPNLDSFVSQHFIGRIKADGELEMFGDFHPIRDYPIKDNKNKEGCLEIFQKPIKSSDGKIPRGRYLAGCLTPGEKVMTDIGLVNVEDVLLTNKLINDKGDLVKIKNCQQYYLENETTYRLKMSNTFRTTNFTSEHPILISKDKTKYVNYPKSKRLGISQRYKDFNFEYKTVDKIEEGNWIKVPNIYIKENDFNIENLWDNNITRIDREINNPLLLKDFWWFVGLWLGDGWCELNRNKVYVSLNKSEVSTITKLQDVIYNIFGRNANPRTRNNCVEISFSSKQLNTFLTLNFGKYADGKHLPEWSKRIDKELKRCLIQGYLDSDGCITKKNNNYTTEFVSINLELLESIQDIIFSLNVVSSLTKLRNAGINTIQNRKCETKETYTLKLGTNDTLNLANQLDKNSEKISRIDFDNLPNTRRKPQRNCFIDESNEYIYFQVKDIITDTYTGIVHNFECDTHTFMCHHITTHNCDPFDDDSSTTNSLGSLFVMDSITEQIVAEYTGRPSTAVEFFENVRRILIYYNAICNYENDKKGLFQYFRNKSSLYLLAENPQILKDMDMQRTTYSGNKAIGTNSGKLVNQWARRLQADWLMKEAYHANESNEEESEIRRLNMHTIRSIGYLKELIAWNIDNNTDRVSAMGMLMILKEDRAKIEVNTSFKKEENFNNNKFWDKHFKRFNNPF